MPAFEITKHLRETVLLCSHYLHAGFQRQGIKLCFEHSLSPRSSSHSTLLHLFIYFLVGRATFFCTFIFSVLLQLLQERLLTSFSSSWTPECNTNLYTPPLPYWHNSLAASLLHCLFLTKPSSAFRVPRLNSFSPGCCHLHWYKSVLHRSFKITFLIISNSSSYSITSILPETFKCSKVLVIWIFKIQ